MAKINVTSGTASAYGQGELQLQNKAPMDSTLRPVTDSANTASPLNLSTSLVQTTSTLKITTNDNPYIDAEDGAGNNRFTVGRDTGSQQVNVDFASNPGGSTTIVGAIRTYVDGVNLSEVMAFREDGNIGINTLTPGAKLDIHSASNVIMQLNRTGAGKSWLQYLQAGTARWNTGYDNTNGNFTIYDAVNAADRMVVTNAGNVGIGTTTPSDKLNLLGTDTTAYVSSSASAVVPAGGSNLVIQNNGNLGYTSLRFVSLDGSNAIGYLGFINNSGVSGSFVFGQRTGGNTYAEQMRIDQSGNVGIGTSTPTTKLTVDAAGVTNQIDIVGSNSAAKGHLGYFSDGVYLSSNYYFNGSQNNDNAGLGQSLIVLQASSGSASRISFNTSAAGSTSTTTRASIDADGLKFNGDTAAANALDDYEEGTWTMGISFGGGSTGVTYSLNTGAYTKIGRQVTVTGYCVLTSKGSSTGNARITGLPFTIAGATSNYSAPTLYLENISFANAFQGFGVNGSTTIALYETTEAGSVSVLDDTNFINSSAFIINFSYFV